MKFENSLVKIYGGFGNQLFQYCFANYLKELEKNVLINNLWFSSVKDKFERNEIFEPEFFGFKRAGKSVLKIYELADRYSIENASTIYKKFDDDNFDLMSFRYINYFVGIWQNSRFINNSKNFLVSNLVKNEEISENFFNKPKKNSVMVHVRMDNYLGEEVDLNYFYKSINFLKKELGDDIYINLFSDSSSILKEKKLISIADTVNLPDEKIDDTLSTFAKMLNNDHFIISNSTFSYMAALMKSGDKNMSIIPTPWSVNKKPKDLSIPQFIEVSRN